MSYSTRRIASLTPTTLGLGGTGFGGMYTNVAHEAAVATLEAALNAGITHIDTAPFYGLGRSERIVGDGVRQRQDGIVLATKVGRLLVPGAHPDPVSLRWSNALPFSQRYDYGRDTVMRSFEDSLQRRGTARIDVVHVHDIGRVVHGEALRETDLLHPEAPVPEGNPFLACDTANSVR